MLLSYWFRCHNKWGATVVVIPVVVVVIVVKAAIYSLLLYTAYVYPNERDTYTRRVYTFNDYLNALMIVVLVVSFICVSIPFVLVKRQKKYLMERLALSLTSIIAGFGMVLLALWSMILPGLIVFLRSKHCWWAFSVLFFVMAEWAPAVALSLVLSWAGRPRKEAPMRQFSALEVPLSGTAHSTIGTLTDSLGSFDSSTDW